MPKIQFKRGLESKLPVLAEGEPGFTTDSQEFYIGSENGNVQFAKSDDLANLQEDFDAQLAENTKKIKDISINIKDYGAKGDGVTDDTISIRDAIEACFNAGGGDVIIPPSPQPFIFTSITAKDNVRLKSTGGKLKLKDNTCVDVNVSYYLIHNLNGLGGYFSNVSFIDLIIDGNMDNNVSFKVADVITAGGENVKVINCDITNAPDSGIMFSGAKNSLCTNNRIKNGRDLGIYVNDGDGTNHYENIISDNRITDFAFGGIGLKRICQRTIVSNNTIRNCGNGITLEQGTTSDYSKNISIIGNRLREIGINYLSAQGSGIVIRESDYTTCIGNRIEEFNMVGITVAGSTGCVIQGNTISSSTISSSGTYRGGLILMDRVRGCIRNIVEGNIIELSAVSAVALWLANVNGVEDNQNQIKNNIAVSNSIAMRVDLTFKNNDITGNTLKGTQFDLAYYAGALNSFVNNRLVNNLISGNIGDWNATQWNVGKYTFWVDSTGKLRTKAGVPTSDTDGTVVGTQA